MHNDPRTRTEDPIIKLHQAAICLHYVEHCSEPSDKTFIYPHGSDMESMELDLLAYRFQDPPPFGSQTESVPAAERLQQHPHKRWPIVIEYPQELDYHSEGRTTQLTCLLPQRKADLLVSSTRFLNCGTRVWHLVITPRPNETFSEFDLIKLIHLYDGRTERTDLKGKIHFRIGDTGTQLITATELPRLLGLVPMQNVNPELRCGTLQLLIGNQGNVEKSATDDRYVSVLDTLRHAREPDGVTARRQLKTWMERNCLEWRIIMAYCGIVTGIFDFDKIDDEEVLDTLDPTYSGTSAFLRIHRRTLISISDDDRSMRECWNRVGISPYLILPHAALLYNETLVDTAERTLDTALKNTDARLALEAAYIDADRHLNTLYLPNVFNYITERTLFEVGSECRGSNAKRRAVLAKLEQCKGHIDIVRERDRNRSEVIVQLLLAVISLLQIKDVIEQIMYSQEQKPGVWLALGLSILALTGVVWWSHKKNQPPMINRNH